MHKLSETMAQHETAKQGPETEKHEGSRGQVLFRGFIAADFVIRYSESVG